ncbi:murein transglycosylase A [Sphingomonas glaciei]|uniref:peptidoglycan lytic exotransglycosylase n=1 Tax=Sphingomonas glaciei TaxID=2938948 RepID=A0ABY5MXC5_9SPHN|nr:MltA domain-containing protein [Sphingomonas glaciei]UUR09103.1 MltA domain-containing protein [Sphingomonas glaciei]
MTSLKFGLGALLALSLAACATRPLPTVEPTPPVATPEPVPTPTPPKPATAALSGITPAAPRPFTAEAALRALAAFRISCPSVVRRPDTSGLTQGEDWRAVCNQARLVPDTSADAKRFFETGFSWVKVGAEPAFATGYWEPEILGSRVPGPGYALPIYRTPADLVRCTRTDGTAGRGRLDETGQCVPYWTRVEIYDGALAGRGLELAYAADPIDMFFLEIQGSGRLKLPDGSVMRIGYDNQNGREYVGVGKLLRDRGILPPGGADMDSIKRWMRAQPDGGMGLMRENLSKIFFKELTGPGPLGALGLPVTARGTVATDPMFVPLGAPVWLDMATNDADGLWVAQDTGGAIKGANRFDTFWGAGEEARRIAGGMSSKGEALLLLPRVSVDRLLSQRAVAQP